MGYEIDFLPVGKGSKGGDAIALRYGNLHGPRSEQMVIVIDGGYTDDGEALVAHIKDVYGTERVDIVVSTHPDQDHVTGLEVVLEQLEVGTLLMHQPWKHSQHLAGARGSSFTKAALSEKLEKSLKEASDLEVIAVRRGVSIMEPFAGTTTPDGCFRILGPSKAYYEEKLQTIQAPASATKSRPRGPYDWMFKAKEAIWNLLPETLTIETLRDDGTTSATNSTSAICLLDVDGRKSLFTGDAGIEALEHVATLLEAEGFQPGDLQFCQVPHHGSRRNVGPSLLNRLLGPKGQTTTSRTAFISVPPENPERKHPAKKVTNAFRRRGYGVHVTEGGTKWHHHDSPARERYITSTPVPFHDRVEEDSEA